MNINKHVIQGSLELKAQEDTLNFIEQVTFAEIINYSAMAEEAGKPKANLAVAQDVPVGAQPPMLALFVETPQKGAVQIITEQLAAGKKIVFQQPAFVGNQRKTVLGFR